MKTPFQSQAALLLLVGLFCVTRPAQALKLEVALASPDVEVQGDSAANDTASLLAYLRRAIGKRYQRGAAGEGQAYDCSGLVQRAYEAAGRTLPRDTGRQMGAGKVIAAASARVGDLLFYRFGPGRDAPLHVAVYIGGGRAIHASVSHRIVREDNVTTSEWARHFVTAIRPA